MHPKPILNPKGALRTPSGRGDPPTVPTVPTAEVMPTAVFLWEPRLAATARSAGPGLAKFYISCASSTLSSHSAARCSSSSSS